MTRLLPLFFHLAAIWTLFANVYAWVIPRHPELSPALSALYSTGKSSSRTGVILRLDPSHRQEYSMRLLQQQQRITSSDPKQRQGPLTAATTTIRSRYTSTTTTSRLWMNENARNFNERLLRDEIQNRNSFVDNEERYAVVDGSGLERLDNTNNNNNKVIVDSEISSSLVTSSSTASTMDPTTTSSRTNKSMLQTKMDRMSKPRAYPLFLLEKATEILEGVAEDVGTLLQQQQQSGSGLDKSPQQQKERIVILGTGWGAASFLEDIDEDKYEVTVISPRNHFVFTPMLAGACVGTVEYRSLCEPIREINRHANFLEATAVQVDPSLQSVTCESVLCEGNSCIIDAFDITYDRLIVSVGAQTNTFGIPGVKEHCNFLKSVQDARRIKSAIVNCFERANFPHLSDAERINSLTFAVIGAGPTGIEFAAELRDFVEQDGPKYYPNLLKFVRIKVIEASNTILAPFDKSLQEEAVKQLQRQMILPSPDVRQLLPERYELVELLLDSSVKEVGSNTIFLKDCFQIPYGLAVWAAGNGPIPLTLQVIDALGSEQVATQSIGRGRIGIDPWMRAIGGNGRIFSLGDCSCILSGSDNSESSGILPATAQVASQQGEYLAKLFNKEYDLSPDRSAEGVFPPPMQVPQQTKTTVSDAIAGFATANWTGEFAKPFQFLNLGILAYTGGGSALAQVTPAPKVAPVKGSGKLGYAVWRSVYLSKQISWRNRLLVLNDWTNRRLFGRDITRL